VEEQIYALGVSKLELDKMVQGEEPEEGTGKGKKKVAATDAGSKLSKAEEAGIEAVEKMMLQQLEDGVAGDGDKESKQDVKDLFKDGLKKAGVNIAE
jgi:SWI/SNF-related matrix-associated actin-dependent regulator 1 of chromatin subfamily A